MFDDVLDECFGAGPWDEHVFGDFKVQCKEGRVADEVVYWFVGDGSFDEFTEVGSLFFCGLAFGLHIELKSLCIKDMCE